MNRIDRMIDNIEQTSEIVFGGYEHNKYDENIFEFIKNKKNNEEKFFGTYFEVFIMNNNSDEAHKKVEEMLDWCFMTKVSIEALAIQCINMFITERKAFDGLIMKVYKEGNSKAFKDFNEAMKDYRELIVSEDYLSFLDDDKAQYAFDTMNENFVSSLKYVLDNHRPEIDSKIFKHLLNNSFDVAYENVKHELDNISLPLSQYNIDKNNILDELEIHKTDVLSIFDNPKQYTKINQQLHFLNPLQYDNWVKSNDGRYVLEGYTKGLTIGYKDKAILVSLDKHIVTRELRTKIKHLKDFDTDESKVLINLCNCLIDFIQQKRYANTIPFKALAKEMNMSKNQAKNYAKRLFSINEKSFLNNFENISLLNK